MSRLREEQKGKMSRLREEQKGKMGRLREERHGKQISRSCWRYWTSSK